MSNKYLETAQLRWLKTDLANSNAFKDIEQGLEAIAAKDIFFNAVHLSFGPSWDFSIYDTAVRDGAIEKLKDVFKRVDIFKPNCYVFHGSFEPVPDDKRSLHIDSLKNHLKK